MPIPAKVYREMEMVVVPNDPSSSRADKPDDDRVPIALSSEEPVERYDWWEGERFNEVLDHSSSAVDLSRATDGLPFLMDHSVREQIGLIEDVTLDADRRLRGMVRFS